MNHGRRALSWEGCVNVRDLGGLLTTTGRETRFGAIMRADNPAYLTAKGWEALHKYGVRTVIGLRTVGADDYEPTPALVPPDVEFLRIEVEDVTNAEVLETRVSNQLWGTPLYFADVLRRWPERAAKAVVAVARARPGGVVVSCGRGCDRTGFIAMLVLHLVGVQLQEIAEDYAASAEQRRARDPAYEKELAALLAHHRCTILEAISHALEGPVTRYLHEGGVTADDVEALERRLVPAQVGADMCPTQPNRIFSVHNA